LRVNLSLDYLDGLNCFSPAFTMIELPQAIVLLECSTAKDLRAMKVALRPEGVPTRISVSPVVIDGDQAKGGYNAKKTFA
jgi:hypothetical protein